MKRTLFLSMVLAACFNAAAGVTYTDLATAWCDDANNVIYDGQGFFAVESAANTSVDLTINLNSLVSYVNSNDYTGSSYMLLWENDIQSYGMGDYADVTVDNGKREPSIIGWITSAYNTSTRISYDTLSSYADSSGNIVLSVKNSTSDGVTVTAKDGDNNVQTLYEANDLRYSSMVGVSGYYVNLNYVTAVTLNTVSTLDTDTYVPPPDYSQPFDSQRTDGTTVGRVTFLGDSITHGVADQSYRWQLFKIFTDNGIENEIVGPRSGYYSNPTHTQDAGSSYGGEAFANVHLAQASGRTHNIISGSTSASVNGVNYSSGVNYGGHSTSSTAAAYDSNTWFCMMGTNDLLSDTPNSGPSTEQYVTQMQKVLGGSVSYDSGSDRYTWSAGDSWGSMETIVNDVCKEGDTFYMLSITPWGNHVNHNRDMDHYAGAEFNRNLEAWCNAYAKESGKNVVYVDVTRGMVDVTHSNRFMGNDAFFNNSSDRLHPNEQGSLLIAGNLAQAMGIGGRTAGLERASAAGWESAVVGELAAGAVVLYGENAFTMEDGYTVDFSAVFGNGATDGWLAAENALSISIGDGTNSGTLNLSEGYIMWGSNVLFCQDNSASGLDALRVVWHNGNEADNVLKGYYVWLGDMLIGQGLSATTGEGLNGILLNAAGASGSLTGLSWTDTAYAPTTLGKSSSEHAYIASQDSAAVSGLVKNSYVVLPNTPAGWHDNAQAVVSSGVDYSGISGQTVSGGACLVTTAPSEPSSFVVSSTDGWIGLTDNEPTGAVNALLTGTAVNAIFGAMNNADAGALTLEIADGGVIEGKGKKYGPSNNVAIAGGFALTNEHAQAAAFNVYVNGGTVNGNIIGGGASGLVTIDSVSLNINSGIVDGTIYGGAMGGTDSTVGSAVVRVNGGKISGDIVAGGNGGTVGNVEVIISGGVIKGSITKGLADRMENAETSVTVVGNKASIGGNIEADRVTLKDVSVSGYADGFDLYSGTITSPVVVLDHVKNRILATLEGLDSLYAVNGSEVELVMGDELELDTLELGEDTSLGIFRGADYTVSTETETTVTITEGLNVRGDGAVLNANLVMAAGSELNLAGNSLQLGSSLTLGGVMLDDVTIAGVSALESGVSLTLFTGVDTLILGDADYSEFMECAASVAFSNPELTDGYRLVYSGSVDGKVSIMAIPEPATATLSLLALAGLCARRRRR